jgi:phosphoglycolate phosphatase-like HAD superfamily hydrolase
MHTSSQSKNIVVGFDMDGVIIDHVQNKITLARRYAVHLSPEDTHSERLPARLSHHDYLSLQDELYGNSDLALSAPLMDGVADLLSWLQGSETHFVLISRRRNPENAIELLSRLGLWGEHFTERNAFFVREPEEKNVIGVREGVTHFFDDERRVLRAMPDIEMRFLVDTFNQFPDEPHIIRVSRLDGVKDILEKNF